MTADTDGVKKSPEPINPIKRREIRKTRHKAERFLYFLCVLITIILILVALTSDAGDWIAEMLFGEEEDGEEEMLLFWILFIPFILFFMMYFYFAMTRAYAIRVTERNFPEIYEKSVEYAARLGLRKVPAVYIEQQNGVINAFAAAVFGKRYAMLNAELVDVSYMEHKDFDTVFFILAHEFGLIYYKHVTFAYNFWVFIPHLIPIFGTLHSRSMEYSCDRVAQLLLGRDGASEFMVITAGRHLYKYVDVEDYLATAKKERGISTWLVNLFATHPITPKRIAALVDPQKKSGRLF
jgi:Zn-dependent protease with chaperone function